MGHPVIMTRTRVVGKADYWEVGSVEGRGHTGHQQKTQLGRFTDVSVTKTYLTVSTLHEIS